MSSRLAILDPIRFAAAAMVVLYHYTAMPSQTWPIASVTKFGYLGVPLFFIISGFVIAMSAANRSAKSFAVSRLLRLYPTYWAGIAFTVVVTTVFADADFAVRQVAANLTMLSPYLGERYVDGVYWTLVQELKFYICVFLLVVVGFFPKHRVWLTAWLIAAYCYRVVGQPFFMGWFISPDYSAFFIIGISLFLVHSVVDRRYGFTMAILAAPLALERSFAHAPQFIHDATQSDQLVAMIVVGFIGLVFLAIATGKLRLSPKPIYLVIGGLTYPLYLIHNDAGKAIMGRLELGDGSEVLMVSAVMAIASFAIYRVIDVGVVPRLKKKLS